MGVIESSPDTPTPDRKPPLEVAAKELKGVFVDTRYTPAASLQMYVEGSSWTVDYYSQVLGEDSALTGQNVNRNAAYQNYQRVLGMELKVTQALGNPSQDPRSKSLLLTGEATVYPFVIPNEGDMFIADIGDGRTGLFKVIGSERMQIQRDACHSIQYQLVEELSQERNADLKEKTIATYHYVRDFLIHGQNPLLIDQDYQNYRQLAINYRDMVKLWFRSFHSNEFATVMVPGQQPLTIYDHFLTKFMTSLVQTTEARERQFTRCLNVDNDEALSCIQLWTLLTERDVKLFYHVNQRMGLVEVGQFSSNGMLEGIFFSNISRVVYPKDPEVSVDYGRHIPAKVISLDTLKDVPSRIRSLEDLIPEAKLKGLPYEQAPLIHPVTIDDYYVLSEAFYERSATGQSKLERAVQDYLAGRAIDVGLLVAMCETYHAWGALERFYYTPILLLLIRATVRSI